MFLRAILRTAFLLLAACAALRAEVPELINYQGLLNDPMGNPVSGNRTMVVRVYDAPSGGNMTYEETIGTVEVANGTFSFEFGSAGGGIAAVLDGSGEYLALSVNGTEEDTRTRLLAVPFALKAQSVISVTGGNSVSSNATGISFTGDAAANTRTNLGLGNSSTRNVGTGESDVASGVHAHAAADVTSGIFDNDRINWAAPGAIGSTTPASGNFTTLAANNGILTASAPVLDLSQTWNNAATTFTGLRFNVTNTASASASLVADFQIGGSSAVQIRRDGTLRVGSTDVGGYQISSNNGGFTTRSSHGTGLNFDSGLITTLGLSNGFELRNGTSSANFRVYNTFNTSTNHERGFLRWTSNAYQIGTEAGTGGGTVRNIEVVRGANTQVTIADSDLSLRGSTVVRWPSRLIVRSESDGNIRFNNWADNDFGRMMFGGTDANYPALKRSGTALQVRLADDSAAAPLTAGNLSLTDNTGNETATFDVQNRLSANRAYILPDSDGTLALTSDIPGGLSDGDKGDITVSGSGTTWSIDAGAIGTAQLGGDITAAGGALLDDADAAAQRTTLGLSAIASSASASDLSSGTVPTARLGTGTANSTTFLRGDQTWATIGGGGASTVDASSDDVFSFSGSDLVADDGGTIDSADPFIKWDDTAGKLVYANPLSRPSGAFYVGLAPTTTALGANAVNIQPARSAAANVAAHTNAVVIGNNSKSSNSNAVAIGNGADSGTNSVAIGPSATTFSNPAGAVAIGRNASANTIAYPIAIGGFSSASAEDAVAVGASSAASGARAVALGRSVSANLRAQHATQTFSSIYWGGTTTDDTANVELNLDATATNRFTIAANTALIADIMIIANSTGAGKAMWANRRVAIRRDGSNNTALIGAVSGTEGDNTGSPTWTFTIDADDTNESLRLRVTGAAGETVIWRATAMYRTVP